MPNIKKNCKFYGGPKQATTYSLFLNMSAVPKKSTSANLAFIWHIQRIGISAKKFDEPRIQFKRVTFWLLSQLSMLTLHFEPRNRNLLIGCYQRVSYCKQKTSSFKGDFSFQVFFGVFFLIFELIAYISAHK